MPWIYKEPRHGETYTAQKTEEEENTEKKKQYSRLLATQEEMLRFSSTLILFFIITYSGDWASPLWPRVRQLVGAKGATEGGSPHGRQVDAPRPDYQFILLQRDAQNDMGAGKQGRYT